MAAFSEKELYPARTIADQANYDAAVEARRIEGLDSGRLKRVEVPCVADTASLASIWKYMRTHDWVWVMLVVILAIIAIGPLVV